MIKLSLIPFIAFGVALVGQSQQANELSAKYPVVTSYEVRPGILMTPKYSDDGEICKMSIERQRATRSGMMMDSFMSEELITEVLEELVPRSERGPTASGAENDALMLTVGGVTQSVHSYANVRYNVLRGSNRETVVSVSWTNRTCKTEPPPLPLEKYPH